MTRRRRADSEIWHDGDGGRSHSRDTFPGQVVLVLQGGGALGAYQAGVFEAMHEAGVEPDWVIGTSIGAINAAIIAGNTHANRLDRLREFWSRVEQRSGNDFLQLLVQPANAAANLTTVSQRHPVFFAPNLPAWLGCTRRLASRAAAYYTTSPLATTLADLVDVEQINKCKVRLTVGAVNVRNGEMRYFDSREEPLAHRSRARVGRAAAGFPGRAHRRRPVLGRRHLLQHADRGGARRQPAPGLGHLQRATVESRRPGAGDAVAGHGKAEGHPVREPLEEPHRAAEADPSPAPRHPRAAQARAGEARATGRSARTGGWGCGTTMHVVRLLAPASTARITRRTSTSRRPAFARAGRRATPTRCACWRPRRGAAATIPSKA